MKLSAVVFSFCGFVGSASAQCIDVPGWADLDGLGCSYYTQNNACAIEGDKFPGTFGMVANDACCVCSGGNGGNPGYDRDFAYPPNMPRPPMMWVEGFASRLHAGPVQKYETPIQVWQTWRLDQAMWNCIAAYHPTALDALTKSRPQFVAPVQYHTSEARALCMVYAVNKLIPDLVPIAAEAISSWLDELGLDSSIMSNEDAEREAKKNVPTPRVLGSWVASIILKDMKEDGWNYDGRLTVKGICTGNCRPFTDTTGYTPVNSPWEITNDSKWQPLIESDNLGFFYAQEHVTPHIGTLARTVILTDQERHATQIDDPGFDYEAEVELAIQRVSALADSPYQRAMVSFMDNKINIAGGMIMRLRDKYNLSLEAQVFYHYGYTSTEIDVVILAWKEKVWFDRIRPTSLVQRQENRFFQSFDGSTIAARDWVPYIRVMPHAEYPSGSGCICLGIAQYIDAFLLSEYGDQSIQTTWNLDEIGDVVFGNMMELADTCGQSRLWGGMHFTASVPKSYELCDGVGTKGYERLMLGLLGRGRYSELMDASKEKFRS